MSAPHTTPWFVGSEHDRPGVDVSEAELLEAIRQELAGRPIYAGEPDDDRYHALEDFEREAMQ
jgi:hypothetical protein